MNQRPAVQIREARQEDWRFVENLMVDALKTYYGGDHRAHAKRIFSTHVSGGRDHIGHFSYEQKMFLVTVDDTPAGMIHIVGKRQGTYKISPIIVAPEFRNQFGLGKRLLEHGERYARNHGAREMYCTVAEQNNGALQFFVRNGYSVAGRSDSHYKDGITELMLYKMFVTREFEEQFDRPHISVLPFEDKYELQVRSLLLNVLPEYFSGVDDAWIDALLDGYRRLDTQDVNQKYKLIFLAVDRSERVFGVAGATPKKGKPIKVMPFVASTLTAFVAMVRVRKKTTYRFGGSAPMSGVTSERG